MSICCVSQQSVLEASGRNSPYAIETAARCSSNGLRLEASDTAKKGRRMNPRPFMIGLVIESTNYDL
jgi:hypothetical protein